MDARTRAQNLSDRVLIVAFSLFLALPLAGMFFGWDFYRVEENRRLAAFPDLGKTAAGDLPDALGTYYEDHFGFRNFCIRRWKRLLRNLDKKLLTQVIPGRDGWLFYDRPDIMPEYYGREETTGEDLEYWRSAIEGRRAWLAERGIRFLFGVAPNKISIYPEMLPDEVRELGEARRHPLRFDRLVQYMEARSDVPVLDLRPVLLAGKGWKTLYFSNDTHWNDYGAYLAYRAVISGVRERFADLPPPLDLKALRVSPATWYGDLARMADLPRSEFTIPFDRITPERDWRVGDTYPAVYRCPRGRRRAVIFHDSFFGRANAFTSQHFEESVFLHDRVTYESLRSVVETYHPDVVIHVLVERMLHRLPEQSDEWEAARRRRKISGRDASSSDSRR